jgi:environmental stress-induced protein Ves
MTWANGSGVTHEVAISPRGAGLTDFDWRISLAEISDDGDFSAFAGVDRVLVLIEGQGMNLTLDSDTRAIEPFSPMHFAGESVASCTLPYGPTRDLNVMYRRDRVTCVVDILDGSSPIEAVSEPGQTLWLGVLTGRWVIETKPALALEPLDFIRIDGIASLIGYGSVVRVSLCCEAL